MAKSVCDAFSYFMQNSVNLDSKVVAEARKNRDELLKELSSVSDEDFFELHADFNLHFGSFSRKTKCRPLNDMDILIGISGYGATYIEDSWNNITINPSLYSTNQQECKDEHGFLDSNKVLGKFKTKLREICDLRVNDVIKRGEAITVQYKAKEWNFDIVPCFYTAAQNNGHEYFLIPNGYGQWKKTDPRIDKKRIQSLVNKFGKTMLDGIRLFKFWNKHAKMVTLDGYVMECLLLNYFEEQNEIDEYVDVVFLKLLNYVKGNIFNEINDPKGIQGNINNLSRQEKKNVMDKVGAVYDKALNAINRERKDKDHKGAINIWRDIFGEEFPKYE